MLTPNDFVEDERHWWRKTILPVIIIGFIGFVIYIYYAEKKAQREDYLLRTTGIKAEAQLTSYETIRTRTRTEYRLAYTFSTEHYYYEGTAVTDQAPVSRKVQVLYVPTDPTINHIDDPRYLYKSHFWDDLFVGLGTAITLGLINALIQHFNIPKKKRS